MDLAYSHITWLLKPGFCLFVCFNTSGAQNSSLHSKSTGKGNVKPVIKEKNWVQQHETKVKSQPLSSVAKHSEDQGGLLTCFIQLEHMDTLPKTLL